VTRPEAPAGGEAAARRGLRAAVDAAPPWFAGAVLGLAVLAALALVGRPAGLGLALLGGALCAVAALAAGWRDPWTVACWLLAGLRRLPLGPLAAIAPFGRAAAGTDRARLEPAFRGGALAPLLLAARHGPARRGGPARARLARLEWVLPLGALVALFAAFVALQLATLFGGRDHVLRTAGLTYAEYARQGFGQLIAAAGLTLAVIAAARRWARTAGRRDERLLRGLLAALCVLSLVVLASALKRLGLYEQAFGFTRLRLLADAHILWLGAVLVLALAAVVTGAAGWLPRAVVALSATGALAFALSNPDGRIAERNGERYASSGQLDLAYLAGLSADAAPAPARLGSRAPCAVARIRSRLEWQPDGLAGANLGRFHARRALRGVPAPAMACPEPPDWS